MPREHSDAASGDVGRVPKEGLELMTSKGSMQLAISWTRTQKQYLNEVNPPNCSWISLSTILTETQRYEIRYIQPSYCGAPDRAG